MKSITILFIIILCSNPFLLSAQKNANKTFDERLKQFENDIEEVKKSQEEIILGNKDNSIKQEAITSTLSTIDERYKNAMNMMNKFSDKTISFVTFALLIVTTILSVMNGYWFFQGLTNLNKGKKEISKFTSEAKKILGETSNLMANSKQEIQDKLVLVNDNAKKFDKEIRSILEKAENIANKAHDITMDKIKETEEKMKKLTNESNEKINKIQSQIIQSLEIKAKIVRTLSDLKIKGTDMKTLDQLFEDELKLSHIDSYLDDLRSNNPKTQEKAIWVIEELGPKVKGKEKTIQILKDVADNTSNDTEVRIQAQRSIAYLLEES